MNIQIKELKNSINSEFFERTLIDIACIKSGILKKNFVNNKKIFFDFKEFQKRNTFSNTFYSRNTIQVTICLKLIKRITVE